MSHHTSAEDLQPSSVGRYLLQQPIARGGMATVHAARLVAAEGVTRLVAAKRLHPQYVDDPEFVAMFHDEARIASRIHHPNVVPVLDVIREGDEVILVQEYVHGVPLSYLIKRALAENSPIALSIALTIISGVLAGLHAAHEVLDDDGQPLGIVHRDVSPQNILVSVDGVPRLVDFGIAKAKTSEHHTREGFFKGKLSYMPPEQLRGENVTRAADIYATGVLLWELVVNRRFHDGKSDPDFVRAVATGSTMTPTEALAAERDTIPAERWAQIHRVEPIINRAMALVPEARYATAADMAAALAKIAPHAPAAEVAAWVRVMGAEFLEKRQQLLVAHDESRRIDAIRLADDGVRSSGSRMRIDPMPIELKNTHSIDPRTISLMVPATQTGSWSERPVFSVRSLAPWAFSAALLVVIGVLGGMAVRSEPAPAITTRSPTTMRVDPPNATAEPEAAHDETSPEAPAPSASVEAQAASSASAAVTARPSAAPVVRFVAPVRVAPIVPAPRPAPPPPPAPASASQQTKDCNPPFYFEGTKKVFKPSCL